MEYLEEINKYDAYNNDEEIDECEQSEEETQLIENEETEKETEENEETKKQTTITQDLSIFTRKKLIQYALTNFDKLIVDQPINKSVLRKYKKFELEDFLTKNNISELQIDECKKTIVNTSVVAEVRRDSPLLNSKAEALFNLLVVSTYGVEKLSDFVDIDLKGLSSDVRNEKKQFQPLVKEIYKENEQQLDNFVSPTVSLVSLLGIVSLNRYSENSKTCNEKKNKPIIKISNNNIENNSKNNNKESKKMYENDFEVYHSYNSIGITSKAVIL